MIGSPARATPGAAPAMRTAPAATARRQARMGCATLLVGLLATFHPGSAGPDPHALPTPPGWQHRRMPIVTVQQSPRDLEPRPRLVAGITQAFVDAYGVSPEAVQVFIHEVDAEHWAKAGRLAADREG